MKGYHIAISRYRGRQVAVLLKGGRLHALEIDPPGAPHPRWGDIYQGVVARIDTSLQCAFIQLDDETEGYLPLPKTLDWRSGQELTVRVMTTPSSSDKSVRVAPQKDRPEGMRDGDRLTRLEDGPDAAHRMLAAHGDMAADIELTDDKLANELMAAFPDLKDRFLIATTAKAKKENILDLLGAADQIDALNAQTVHLPGDGSLVIEHTQALTVIDVNSGGQAALDTNLAAATEIARQIRLRNIGGIILADMINMPRSADRKSVLAAFTTAFADDTCQIKLHGFTRLGLVEITRSRRTPSLNDCLSAAD